MIIDFKVIPVLLDIDTKEGLLDNGICLDMADIVKRDDVTAETDIFVEDDSLKEEDQENVEIDSINQVSS
jgi:hypothetical protein